VKSGSAFSLSSEFWSRFAEQHWEQKPLLIKHAFAEPLITAERTFQALVKASDQFRVEDESVQLGFYIEQTALLADVGKFLPRLSDETSARYARRVKGQLGGRRFGIICEQFQIYDALLWRRIREFLHGLFQHVDLPSAKAALFFGDYEKTPFGLHDGESSNFKFVIAGRKKMRLWPDKYFRNKNQQKIRHSMEYEKFFDGVTTLEGEPGDVIYWPSDCWHIGEPVGGLAVSLSVALFPDARRFDPLAEELVGQLNAQLAPIARSSAVGLGGERLQKNASKLRRRFDDVAKTLRQLSQDRQFKQRTQMEWLNRMSAFGFARVPAPSRRRKLKDHDIVHGDVSYPILWLPFDDDEIICSANGHALCIGAHPNLLKLLAKLNSGERCRVANLLKENAGSAVANGTKFVLSRRDVRVFLETLLRFGGIQISGRGG
jgi:hypothetical protein